MNAVPHPGVERHMLRTMAESAASRRLSRRFPVAGAGVVPQELVSLSLGDLDLVRVRLNPQQVRTAPAQPRCLMLSRAFGPLTVRPANQLPVEVAPGRLIISQNSTPIVTTCAKPTWLTCVAMPTTVLTEFGVMVPTNPLQVLDPSLLVPPMWRFVDGLLDQPQPWPPTSVDHAQRAVHDLIGAVLLELAARPARVPVERPLVERARQHVATYSGDPRLTPQRVADSLGVPLRRLQRRFTEIDSGLGQEIRMARARAAIRLMTSPSGRALSMEDVAAQCGYQNAVAMRRSFAQLGLEQPRRYRRRPRVGPEDD